MMVTLRVGHAACANADDMVPDITALGVIGHSDTRAIDFRNDRRSLAEDISRFEPRGISHRPFENGSRNIVSFQLLKTAVARLDAKPPHRDDLHDQ